MQQAKWCGGSELRQIEEGKVYVIGIRDLATISM